MGGAAADSHAVGQQFDRPFIVFLMVTGRLRPGLRLPGGAQVDRFRRYLNDSPLQPDMSRFGTTATELGFTEK